MYIEYVSKFSVNIFRVFSAYYDSLSQACQTQTSLRAEKATKTAKGAAKVPKNPSVGHI